MIKGQPSSAPACPQISHKAGAGQRCEELPRGIRNNNPLNIRLVPDNRWQGRVLPRLNSDVASEQLEELIMRLRAAAVLLIAYYDRRHLDTIRKLVQV